MKCYGFHIFGILELGERPCEVLKMEKRLPANWPRQRNRQRLWSSLTVETLEARSARRCCWVGGLPWTPASTDQGFCAMNGVMDVQRTPPWRLKSPDDWALGTGVAADAVQTPTWTGVLPGAPVPTGNRPTPSEARWWLGKYWKAWINNLCRNSSIWVSDYVRTHVYGIISLSREPGGYIMPFIQHPCAN